MSDSQHREPREVDEPQKASFAAQLRSMPANFWYANLMEILERLAFYGVRAIAPLYLIKSAGENGLGLSYTEKGDIYMIWAFLQCLIPMVSGGYTERYGYRRSLAVAFVLNILGYLGMAQSKAIADHLAAQGWADPGYWVFMLAACCVATGTAIFKPPVHGTIAKSVSEESSSLGWGTFYWMVNIGGAFGPMAAATLRHEIDWSNVFYAAAIVTACNFLPAFLLYKEPPKELPQGGTEKAKGPFGVFVLSILTICKDVRLVVFLLIFSCFWLMFMQLWDLLPNFIDEWVDSSDVAPIFAWFNEAPVFRWFCKDWVLANGQTKPEIIINIDAWSIIALVLVISWLVRKLHKVAAMVIGMVIALVGFVASGATSIGWLCCVAVFVFSIGEMACSPTFSAYVGLIAPKDKKALYMGYSNIPFAIGWAAGSKIGAVLYENLSSKFNLAREYLVNQLGVDPSFATSEKLLPNERVMETMAYLRDGGAASAVQEASQSFWDKLSGVEVLTKQQSEELVASLDQALGGQSMASVQEATRLLWDMHHPYQVWYYLGIVGLVGTVGMIIFYFTTRGSQTASANQAEDA